jgi:hypothetical protein
MENDPNYRLDLTPLLGYHFCRARQSKGRYQAITSKTILPSPIV